MRYDEEVEQQPEVVSLVESYNVLTVSGKYFKQEQFLFSIFRQERN